jgi:hypothetical protein
LWAPTAEDAHQKHASAWTHDFKKVTVPTSSQPKSLLFKARNTLRMASDKPDIKVRAAEESDLESILKIVNHSILNSTANLDSIPYEVEEKRPWFDSLKKKCAKELDIYVLLYMFRL